MAAVCGLLGAVATVTDESRAAFGEDGFVVISGVVTGECLAEVRPGFPSGVDLPAVGLEKKLTADPLRFAHRQHVSWNLRQGAALSSSGQVGETAARGADAEGPSLTPDF
jgi:hypothetical protein